MQFSHAAPFFVRSPKRRSGFGQRSSVPSGRIQISSLKKSQGPSPEAILRTGMAPAVSAPKKRLPSQRTRGYCACSDSNSRRISFATGPEIPYSPRRRSPAEINTGRFHLMRAIPTVSAQRRISGTLRRIFFAQSPEARRSRPARCYHFSANRPRGQATFPRWRASNRRIIPASSRRRPSHRNPCSSP